MGMSEFEARAKEALELVGKLRQSIAEVEPASGHFVKSLNKSAGTQENLGSIGRLKLSGSIGAAVHLTRGLEPPLDLEDIQGDPSETGVAYASGIVVGSASAGFDTQVEGAGWNAGVDAEAGGGVTLAVHRRHRQTDGALAALVDLLPAMAGNPFTLSRLRSMDEGETLQYEMQGTAALSATAGWSYGTVRALAGTALDRLEVGDLGGVKTGATAGLTLAAGLSGQLSVLVTRADKPSWRRVSLHKKKGHFVGAGLEVKASLALTQEDEFVDGVLGRALALPDRLVRDVSELKQKVSALQSELAGLGEEAKRAVEEALGSTLEDVGLDKLEQLGGKLSSQSALVQQALAPVQGMIESLADRLGAAQPNLAKFVDHQLSALSQPLARVSGKLFGWLEGYDALRGKVRDQMLKRAEQGMQAELSLGVNRSRTKEALVVLDFDLDNEPAADACLKAMKGNFNPGLLRANGPGAHGVELVSGALKDTLRRSRSFSLQLNLLGLELGKTVKSWDELTVETDLGDDSVYIVGQAATELYSSVGRRIQELSFVFDLYGGAQRRDDDKLYLEPGAGFSATIHRRSEFARLNRIRKLVPSHLNAARQLKPLEADAAAALEQRLLAEDGSYSFTLDLSFPPEALRHAFLVDQPQLKDAEVRQLLWGKFKTALEMFDLTVQDGRKHHLLSALITDKGIAQVQSTPDAFKKFPAPVVDGGRLSAGPTFEVWGYVRSGYDFIEGCVKARRALLSDKPAKKVNKALRDMSRRAASAPGTFSNRIDAKYLSLALVEGPVLSSVTITLARGAVSVTL